MRQSEGRHVGSGNYSGCPLKLSDVQLWRKRSAAIGLTLCSIGALWAAVALFAGKHDLRDTYVFVLVLCILGIAITGSGLNLMKHAEEDIRARFERGSNGSQQR